MAEKKYFGTDGIRGEVGKGVITPEFVLRLGAALGRVVARHNPGERCQVLIGKDTRISGYMLESALEAGLSSAGVDVGMLGPMPTPGIAYLTRTFNARAGIVISASHNPYFDNGIKFFGPDGTKLNDALELEIEAEIDQPVDCVASEKLGKAKRIVSAAGRYVEFCKSTVPRGFLLKGMKIVVDCAHGATYHTAPYVFEELGAEVITIGAEPDGININADCGSTKPELLQKVVVENQADLGIALDGDGDRVQMVDHTGAVLDGDDLLFVIARYQAQHGGCKGVAGTLMSNLGFEQALEKMSIPFVRTQVGDRYVVQALKEKGWVLGGETSGHILCLDRTSTGDGIISALQVLVALKVMGESLFEARSKFKKFPQVMVNVRLEQRPAIDHPTIVEAVNSAEQDLADSGRVLLRPSGTEPVVRVMVEGSDGSQVQSLAHSLADVVRSVSKA